MKVSSYVQKADLERQSTLLELYCTKQGWPFEIISDLGSGMNYHKKGLKKLLHSILKGTIERLVLTYKIDSCVLVQSWYSHYANYKVWKL